MTSSVSTSPTPQYSKEEWLKKYQDRLTLIQKLESGEPTQYSGEKFEPGMPVPRSYKLFSAFEPSQFFRFRIYVNLTNNCDAVYDSVITATAEKTYNIAKQSLLIMEFLKIIPEITPASLLQHFLLANPFIKYESYRETYIAVINNLKNAYSLTAEDILQGMNKEQLASINPATAKGIGITSEHIKKAKVALNVDSDSHKHGTCAIV